ncbi:MAG: hypothetical protein ACK5BV_04195, partial [Bacteroidota bacterium]
MYNKFFFLIAGLLMLSATIDAQDIKTVRKLYDKKEWVKGKEAVDLLLANPAEQNNWEAWYFKGLIYGQMAKSADLKAQVPEGWVTSFEAYQKAMELDSKQSNTYMTLRGYPVFDNYLELQKEGNDFFNTQGYKDALGKYKQADLVGRFIFKNGWALAEVDTILYYYAGAAAMQANMVDDAVNFYKKIADANIGGEGYDVCYRYLTYHYDKKAEKALDTSLIYKSKNNLDSSSYYLNLSNSFKEKYKSYSSAGRKLYPNDTYYDKLELDRERNNNGLSPELFAKYEVVISKEPGNYD